MPGVFATRARGAGKSARTRARLMDAAAEAIARHGFEAVSASEIAHAAEVSNGTFYNYFRDRDEITDVVAFAIAAELARRIDEALRDVTDPVERISFGTRQFVELAAREPVWGRAMLRAMASLPKLRREVSTFARSDLERGAREGVFKLEIDDLLVDLFTSMVATAVLLRLEGGGGPDPGARTAEHQLRMLGVPAARARRAATRPLRSLSLVD
jgi:AcrR family transcriptional regulator